LEKVLIIYYFTKVVHFVVITNFFLIVKLIYIIYIIIILCTLLIIPIIIYINNFKMYNKNILSDLYSILNKKLRIVSI